MNLQYFERPSYIRRGDNVKRGGLTLWEVYIQVGFCPRMDFYNIMHNDCITYNYSICDIVSHLPI